MILIVSDGQLFDGGYATLSYNIYEKIRNIYQCEIFHFTFKDVKSDSKIKYCNITYNSQLFLKNKHNKETLMSYLNNNSQDVKDIFNTDYNLIISTSPASLYLISFYFNKKNILYIKGGFGLNDHCLKYCQYNYLLNLDGSTIGKYIDYNTITVEDNAFYNNDNKIIIICTSYLVKVIIQKMINFNVYRNIKYENVYGELPFLNIIPNKNNISGKKDYDLIFVTNNHNKITKNSNLVYKIYKQLPKLKKIVIGSNAEKYLDCENTEIYDFMPNEILMQKISLSKIMLIPSVYDCGPNTMIEAINNNCIPILYRNCGYSAYVNNDFVLDNLQDQDWIQKIKKCIVKTLEENEYKSIYNIVENSTFLFLNLINKYLN